MSVTVKVSDVVAAMDVDEGWAAYIHRQTGETVRLSPEDQEFLDAVDDEGAAQGRLTLSPAKLREIADSEDFLPLPDRYEFDEPAVMAEFARSAEDPALRDALNAALRANQPGRRFLEAAGAGGVLGEWRSFRDEVLTEIAARFLTAHEIAHTGGIVA